MNLRQATAIVITVLQTATDSLGPADQDATLQAFLRDPLDGPQDLLIFAGTCTLGSFFNHPTPRFDAVRDRLWPDILNSAALPAHELGLALRPETLVFTLANRLLDLDDGRTLERFAGDDVNVGTYAFVCTRCEPPSVKIPPGGPAPLCDTHGVPMVRA